ncbi:Putative uncharacterized protein [Moritella viscosa]|nr:Putative uncharacterized protein [Moritella viscosa]
MVSFPVYLLAQKQGQHYMTGIDIFQIRLNYKPLVHLQSHLLLIFERYA